jgi:hypothetical protein
MRREDKFGYGFLAGSVAVPLLIFVFFDSKIVAAILGGGLLAVGIMFLIFGHTHKEQTKGRTKMGTIMLFTMVGGIIGLSAGLFSGIAFVVTKKPTPAPPVEIGSEPKMKPDLPPSQSQPKSEPSHDEKEPAVALPRGETPRPPRPTVRPYDLSPERRLQFLKWLKPPQEANTIRVGCATWSERACVAAGQFAILFSEAGWNIDGNRVFRLEPQIPGDGVFIVSLPEPGPQLPPHLGRWHAMDLTEITLHLALMEMGLNANSGNDATLAAKITGVYFGPEPQALIAFDKHKQLFPTYLMKVVMEGKAIQARFAANNDPKAEMQDETKWTMQAESWLRTNLAESDARNFAASNGVEAKNKALLEIVTQLIPPTPPRK